MGRVVLTVWVFSTAHLIPALWWISQSMITKGGTTVYLVPLAIVGLPMMLALFPAIAIATLYGISRPKTLTMTAIAVALGWTIGEAARSYLLTGFPWHIIGYAWVDVPLIRPGVAVIGVLGMGALTVLAAVALAPFAAPGRWRWLPLLIACLGITAAVTADTFLPGPKLQSSADSSRSTLNVRVVQPNVAQKDKWQPGSRDRQIADLIRLTGQSGFTDVDLIVWPETAITFLADQDPRLLDALDTLLVPGQYVIGGTVSVHRDSAGRISGLYNSMVVIDHKGEIINKYHKRHLVPFGEYLPLRFVFERIGVSAIAWEGDFLVGSGDPMIYLPEIGRIRPLICYEAIFPQDLFGLGLRPDIIVVGTNDAWYGNTAGPQQHAAMHRMRSVEWGIPLVRAANTGVSLVADAFGEEIQRLDFEHQGVLTMKLPVKRDSFPLYTLWGDFLYLLISGLLLMVFLFVSRYKNCASAQSLHA